MINQTWNEIAEQLFVERHELWQRMADSDSELPFPDPRAELIAKLTQCLREAMIFWKVNSDMTESYFDKWQVAAAEIASLRAEVARLERELMAVYGGLLPESSMTIGTGER